MPTTTKAVLAEESTTYRPAGTLLRNPHTKAIIMLSLDYNTGKEMSGVLIHAGGGVYKLGEYRTDWIKSSFGSFNGIVTLES